MAYPEVDLSPYAFFSLTNQRIFDTIRKVDDPVVQANLGKGYSSGLWCPRSGGKKSWSSLRLKLSGSKNDQVIKLVSQLSQIFGDRSISEDALKLLLNKNASITDRREALAGLIAMRFKELPPKLEFLLETELQIDAIRLIPSLTIPRLHPCCYPLTQNSMPRPSGLPWTHYRPDYLMPKNCSEHCRMERLRSRKFQVTPHEVCKIFWVVLSKRFTVKYQKWEKVRIE